MHNIARSLFYIFTFASVLSVNAQIGNWTMVFTQTRLHEKWSLHAEAQHRNYDIRPSLEQLLLRAGGNFHLSEGSLLSGGYGYISNYSEDKEIQPGVQSFEHRIWQQFLAKNTAGRFIFEHRYRLEQRWLHAGSVKNYRDRARAFLRATVLLNRKSAGPGTLFLSAYNEVFLHISDQPFDRNRLYGAIGYQFTPAFSIQTGLLAQTVATTTKRYLQFALFLNPDLIRE